MALDKVRIEYEAAVDKATADLGKFNKEQQKVDQQAKKNQKTFETNAQKRSRIIKEEQQDLKELKKRSDDAFEPTVIQDYNKRIADANRRIKALNGEQSKAVKSQGKFNDALLRGVQLLAGAFAVERLITFGKELFTTAVQMEAFERRARVVFGKASKEVEAFAKANALALGFTQTEFLGATAAIGDILIPLGFARDRAAEMSIEAVRLGTVLKEFTGDQREASEISNIVAKAFTGEVESLKGLGIVINQNDTVFKDLIKTKIRDEGVTEQQARALAIYESVLNSSADAIASYEKNTDSLSRKQEELGANIRQVRDNMARGSTPAFQVATQAALDFTKSISMGITAAGKARYTGMIIALDEMEKQAKESVNILDVLIRKISEVDEATDDGGDGFKEYANTIDGLKEKVKDYRLQLTGLDLDTDQFLITQKQLTDAQEELDIALGKTNKTLKKNIDLTKERNKVALDLLKAEEQEAKDAEDFANAANKFNAEALQAEQDVADENIRIAKKERDDLADIQDEKNVKFFESLEDRKIATQEAADSILRSGIDLINTLGEARALAQQTEINAEIEAIRFQQRIDDIGTQAAIDQLEKGSEAQKQAIREQAEAQQGALQLEKGLAEESKAIRRGVALQQRDLAIFQVTVDGIQAVQKALASVPPPANIPLAVAAGVASAAQLTALLATPIPQFAKGTTDAPEGMAMVGEKGTEMIFLPQHSRVLSHEPTIKYKQELDAMQDGSYENLIQRQFVKAVVPDSYDDYLLRRAVKKNKSVKIENIGELSRAMQSNNYLNSRYSS